MRTLGIKILKRVFRRSWAGWNKTKDCSEVGRMKRSFEQRQTGEKDRLAKFAFFLSGLFEVKGGSEKNVQQSDPP
jgi:hypothetical protein